MGVMYWDYNHYTINYEIQIKGLMIKTFINFNWPSRFVLRLFTGNGSKLISITSMHTDFIRDIAEDIANLVEGGGGNSGGRVGGATVTNTAIHIEKACINSQ